MAEYKLLVRSRNLRGIPSSLPSYFGLICFCVQLLGCQETEKFFSKALTCTRHRGPRLNRTILNQNLQGRQLEIYLPVANVSKVRNPPSLYP